MNLTEQQVLDLAPDESSKKSGLDLSRANKWLKFLKNEKAIWGECQGSGKLPYQTSIDLSNIAFKCSCPSHKFPCKHGLGLLLIYTRDQALFKESELPEWINEWLEKRKNREQTKSAPATEKKVDPEAQKKRQKARQQKVEDGISDLKLWMKDLVRNGIVSVPEKGPNFFEEMARRMVDAQAPGLSMQLKSIGEINYFVEGWQKEFLYQLSRLYLTMEGYSNIQNITSPIKDDVSQLTGFPTNNDEIKQQQGITDTWLVLSKETNKEEALFVEKNWLYGKESGRYALFLQFYVRTSPPSINLYTGAYIKAELCFFPGIQPFRVLFKNAFDVVSEFNIIALADWKSTKEYETKLCATNPFIYEVPVIIDHLALIQIQNKWYLKDSNNDAFVIPDNLGSIWKLLALTGGKPVPMFLLGRESTFMPKGIWLNNQYQAL